MLLWGVHRNGGITGGVPALLRVVGGKYGGRKLATPRGDQTRPTSDMAREGLFNALSHLVEWEGLLALDLFAGSGALGIEAISRGAERVVFVESHGKTVTLIRENLRSLGVEPERARVLKADVAAWLEKIPEAGFGLVLMDPPYAYAGYESVLKRLARQPAVASGALIVVEADRTRELEPPANLELVRLKRYGDTQIFIYQKK